VNYYSIFIFYFEFWCGRNLRVHLSIGCPRYRTIGTEASNCSKDRLRQGKTAGEVGGGVEVGDEPVTEPSKLRGGVKELGIKSYRRRPASSGGVPVYGVRQCMSSVLGTEKSMRLVWAITLKRPKIHCRALELER